MEKKIDTLLTNCNISLKKINSQKLSNVNILGDSILQLRDACQERNEIEMKDLVELRCSKRPFQHVRAVFELFKIFNIQDVVDLKQYTIQKATIMKKDFLQEYDFPFLKENDSPTKVEYVYMAQLKDFHNFNFLQVKDEAIEYLNQFDYSSNGVFNKNVMQNASKGACCLLQFIMHMKTFCQNLNQLKSHISLEYDSIANSIFNLVSYLQDNEKEMEGQTNSSKIQSNVELQIQKVISISKNKLIIEILYSNFMVFFQLNADFKSWISHKRPLTYWHFLDNQSMKVKGEELVGFYLYQHTEEIVEPIEIGFDFLLILNVEELRQIKHLEIKVRNSEDALVILNHLKYLQILSLRSLYFDQYVFLKTAWSSKEYTDILNAFLESQNQIEEFSLDYNNSTNIIANLETIYKLSTLSQLRNLNLLNFYYHYSEIEFKRIVQMLLSLKNLEKLSFLFYQNYENKIYSNYDLQFPKSLKVLHLRINIYQSEILNRFHSNLQELKQLEDLTLEFNYLGKDFLSKELFNSLKYLHVYLLRLKVDGYLKYNKQDIFYLLIFQKLRKLICFKISPSIDRMLRYQIKQ